jgi:hypothetical protein
MFWPLWAINSPVFGQNGLALDEPLARSIQLHDHTSEEANLLMIKLRVQAEVRGCPRSDGQILGCQVVGGRERSRS